MGAILTVDNINVYYGSIHAIKGISFEVNAGEIVTLIGANGAGKSTTLNTISGLLRSRTGFIQFHGRGSGQAAPSQDPVQGSGTGSGRTAHLFTDDRPGEPGYGGVHPQEQHQAGAGYGLRPLPPPEGTFASRWQAPCPAANSRCWPWAVPS